MKHALVRGVEIPMFSDVYEAEDDGFLTRKAWRTRGKTVPRNASPGGLVITRTSLLHKCMAKPQMVIPILGEKDDLLVIAYEWFDVFTEPQTNNQKRTQLPQTPIISINSKDQGEEGGGSSLMTPKVSEQASPKEVTTNTSFKDIRTVNSVRAYVPEGLVLPDKCPVKEQIWWFLGLLYWKHLELRLPWETPINLKYDYLKDDIPNWTEVWRWCDGLRMVERTAGYTPGERSYGYWTAAPYRDQTHRLRMFEHAGLAKRLRSIERKHDSRPILKHLKEQLRRLSVDLDGFQQQFADSPNRYYYEAHLQTILDGEIRLTTDEFSGRYHSNVSNMYKPLRSLLRVDGESDTLGETDIKNSQPLFLAIAAMEHGVQDARYLRLCEDGQIYEHFANRIGILRESAKHEMMVYLYGKNGYRSTTKSLFEREFPAIAAFIHRIKQKDHKRLARQMQIAERKLVIDTVCERLRRQRRDMFLATIHDAILVRKGDCPLIVSVMSEAFAEKGVRPRLEWQDVNQHALSVV